MVLKVNKNPNILELCCGTGSQSNFLSKIVKNGTLDCVDINKETIIENQNYVRNKNINYHVSDIDMVDDYTSKSLDLIFSSYGFYYSKNPEILHKRLHENLSDNGKFVIVGPTFGNNIELYEIMSQIGVKIDDNVLYASEKFMLDMEVNFLKCYGEVNFYRALNRVSYDSIDELLKYWENTTFYDADKEGEFMLAAEKFYKNDIVVTKSISYLEGVI